MSTKEFMTTIMTAAITAVILSCSNVHTGNTESSNELQTTSDTLSTKIEVKYAKGFSIKYLDDGIRLIDIIDPQKAEIGDANAKNYGKIALVKRGAKASNIPEDYDVVEVPINSTICMTSLQLSNFTALDAHDFVKGITGTKNLFNADILQRVKDGRIVKIGMEGNFDPELVMAASPDVIFISPFKRGGYDVLSDSGIKLVAHLGYKESNPLGQAEWVKFIGMFIGKEHEANAVFSGIEERYNNAKAKAATAINRPTVFSGEMHDGNWYAVGGASYLAQLFKDAGAEYILNKNTDTGAVIIGFEKMYAEAANADFWRIVNSYPETFSYEALKASDPRNADFKAFKERKVIYCNMHETAFYEKTPMMQDVILNDLIAIFHPELADKNYIPTFYKLLK